MMCKLVLVLRSQGSVVNCRVDSLLKKALYLLRIGDINWELPSCITFHFIQRAVIATLQRIEFSLLRTEIQL